MATTGEPTLPPPTSATLRKTVAVVDMVAYGAISKILEENIGPASVTELNRQIQSFITAAVEHLPDQRAVCVVTRTGDGIILLFDHAQDAHTFARDVLLRAQQHNDQRTERTAQRWFRIGIATGEISATACTDRPNEFAGTVIANAVRLEGAACPGAIIIDTLSFLALSPESKLLYSRERIVEGKRKETFKARQYRVTRPRASVIARSRPLPSRRVFLGSGATALAGLAIAAYFERDHIHDRLYPLPELRHIALLAWPPGATESAPMLASILDSIHARLTRAEAYAKDFLVLTANDMADATKGTLVDVKAEKHPNDIAESWGANLIFAVHVAQGRQGSKLRLQIIDAETAKQLRSHEILIDASKSANVNRAASDSAVRLLDLPQSAAELSDEAELAKVSSAVRDQYEQAKLLEAQPGDAKHDDAIEKYQEALTTNPRFALAYAGLGTLYLSRFVKSHDPDTLGLAGGNLTSALRLNPNSERAMLGYAQFQLASGKPQEALLQLADVLRLDPLSSDVILLRAKAFRQLNRPKEEEQTYRDLIRNRPSYWRAYNNLGAFLQEKAKYGEAADCFNRASLLAPRTAIPLVNLGTVYIEAGRTDDAIAAFTRSNAIMLNETACENLGTIAYQRKDYASALRLYLQAEQLSPADYFILSDLGDCYEMLGQPQKTIQYYTKAAAILNGQLQLNPKDGPAWMTLAFYSAKIGDKAAAHSAILEAGRRNATEVASNFTKARALALLGEKEEAKRLVLLCLKQGLSPADVELAPELTSVRLTQGYKSATKTAA